MQTKLFVAGTRCTEVFNIAVDDSDAKKAACYSRLLVVTDLVVSGTRCTFLNLHVLCTSTILYVFVRELKLNHS